jgi:CrcB protein
MDILAVGLGGLVGAITRYFFYRVEQTYSPFQFPFSTLVVNILGCFLMGILIAHLSKAPAPPTLLSLFLGVGFLGSLTTFSTFTAENYNLMTNGHWPSLFSNITLHVALSLAALFIGVLLTSKLQTP